jgi:hypothetical protein
MIKTLILFCYKIMKTIFIVPWIIFDLTWKNWVRTISDLGTTFNVNFIDPFLSMFEVFSLNKLKIEVISAIK